MSKELFCFDCNRAANTLCVEQHHRTELLEVESMSKEQQSRLNIELFKKVREKIATTPDAYDQGHEAFKTDSSPCGTAACIGGWADILSATTEFERLRRMDGYVDLDRAADALGLSGEKFWEEYVSDSPTERAVLFTGDPDAVWPVPFRGQWVNAVGRREQASVALAYLDHIIKTGKVLE